MDPKQLSKLPANNLFAEWYLVKFGSLASESLRHWNKFFKWKQICDDLMFNKSEESTEKLSFKSLKNIFKALDSMEDIREKRVTEKKSCQIIGVI